MILAELWEKYILALEEDWPRSPQLSKEDLLQAIQWCKEHCKGEWHSWNSRVYLKESQDATFFMLKWS